MAHDSTPLIPTRLCSHKEGQRHTCECGHSTTQAPSAFPNTHKYILSSPCPLLRPATCVHSLEKRLGKNTHPDPEGWLQDHGEGYSGVQGTPSTCRRWVVPPPATHSGHSFPTRRALGGEKARPSETGVQSRGTLAGDRLAGVGRWRCRSNFGTFLSRS